jgi:glycosyltransferase involved in cell wall biosynthesis
MLAEAIESAMQPDYTEVEHLVLDGRSTDGTLEVLKRYPHLRVISEDDQGMYDALNKGLRMARGEVIGMLNSDDCYSSGVFARAAECLEVHPDAWAVAGDAELFQVDLDGNRRQMDFFPAIPPGQLWSRLTVGIPAINAWFFRREVFEQLGGFNLTYPISADREFMLRLAFTGFRYATFSGLAYSYRQHPGSQTMSVPPDRGRPYLEPAYIIEKLRIAESYLDDPTLPVELRPVMRHWHADITSGQVLYALRYGQFRRAIAHAGVGWRRNLIWPKEFTARVVSGQKKKYRSSSHR